MIADVPTGAWLVWLGPLVMWATSALYVRDAWQGRIFPSPVSWSVWTATSGLSAAAAFDAGSPLGALVPAAVFVRCAAIVAALTVGARRARERDLRRDPAGALDWWCLAAAGFGLAAWLIVGDPLVALLVAVVTDAAAAAPTYRNAWRRGETWGTYGGAAANPVTALLVTTDLSVPGLTFPLYELAVNVGLVAVVWARGTPVSSRHRDGHIPARRPVARPAARPVVARPDRPGAPQQVMQVRGVAMRRVRPAARTAAAATPAAATPPAHHLDPPPPRLWTPRKVTHPR